MKRQSCLHRRHILRMYTKQITYVVATHSIMQIMFKDNYFIKEILLQPIDIVHLKLFYKIYAVVLKYKRRPII